MEKIICYHHNDLDGYAAAWQVHLNESDICPENFISKGYDEPFDRDHKDAIVYIVDLSFTKTTFQNLLDICEEAKKVIWIDHHRSSIELMQKYKGIFASIPNLYHLVCENTSGCALTYLYFKIVSLGGKDNLLFDNNMIVSTEFDHSYVYKTDNKQCDVFFEAILPTYLAFISDYDCWIKSSPDTDYFIKGCDSENYHAVIEEENKLVFNIGFWNSMNLIVTINKFIDNGKAIMKYLKQRYKEELNDGGYESEYEGRKIYCLNSRGNSFNFCDKIDQYPMVVLFEYNGKNDLFCYSLYSSLKYNGIRMKCNEIAEKFGGGGHVGAAGFSSKEMIFKPIASE